MSDKDSNVVDMLDVRLRRLHAGLDASAGFDARVYGRVEALERGAGRAPADLRAQFERRSAHTLRRLRREAWMNGISACALVLTGVVLLMRFLPGLLVQGGELAAAVPGPARLATVLSLVAAAAFGSMKATGTSFRLR